MIVDLDDYRKKKKKVVNPYINVPVFSRVYIEDNKLIGEVTDSKQKIIIKDYNDRE